MPKNASLQHCKCHKLVNRQNHLQLYFSRLQANSAMHLLWHSGERQEKGEGRVKAGGRTHQQRSSLFLQHSTYIHFSPVIPQWPFVLPTAEYRQGFKFKPEYAVRICHL